MKRMDISEKIFSIIAHVLLILFALACVYPLIFVVSSAISAPLAVEAGKIVLWPVGFQMKALIAVASDFEFWLSYCNTIFLTIYGTAISMVVAITGAYALSKTRLMFGRGFNFMLVFTMWFSAGMIPTYMNFVRLGINNRFGFILGLGFNAFNMILLRNAFTGVPHEIEEAATIDGATEFQILSKIYIPMSTSSIATVTMFFALSRWNGYFWAQWLLPYEAQPLQVYMRTYIDKKLGVDGSIDPEILGYSLKSYQYSMIVCSIIPIIIIYPQMQKYFAAGVNVGGVKE